MDFNGDGSWGGPRMNRSSQSRDVVVGDNVLMFDVPSFALAGTTYAWLPREYRGRLGSRLAWLSMVRGGRLSGNDRQSCRWQRSLHRPGLDQRRRPMGPTECVCGGCGRRRGHRRAVARRSTTDTIAWYENDGSENFTRSPEISTVADSAVRVCLRRTWTTTATSDVLSARRLDDDTIAWYENDGSENFHAPTRSARRPMGLPSSVFAADVDGDGDMDVLSASLSMTTRSLGTRTTAVRTSRRHPISTAADTDARIVFAADMDGTETSTCSARPTPSTRLPGTRTTATPGLHATTSISTSADGRVVSVFAGRGRDGDLDVLSASAETTTRSPGTRTTAARASAPTSRSCTTYRSEQRACLPRTWTATATLDVLERSRSMTDDDCLVRERRQPGLHANTPISTTADAARNVFAADVDGDGITDVLSASQNDDTIAWYTAADS